MPNGKEYIEALLIECNGELPTHTNMGGYPLYYLDQQDTLHCAACATKNKDKIVYHNVHWEGVSLDCEECREEIESAYGEPDEEQPAEEDTWGIDDLVQALKEAGVTGAIQVGEPDDDGSVHIINLDKE